MSPETDPMMTNFAELGAEGKPGFTIRAVSYGEPWGQPAKAVIEINGNDVSPNGRGMNVVVLNPDNGQIDWKQSYDTSDKSDGRASTSLTQAINKIPAGRIVVVAVRGDGAGKLLSSSKQALVGIGSDMVNQLGKQDSWAIIGRKGAAPGSALVRENLNKRGYAPVTFTQQPDPIPGKQGSPGLPGDRGQPV